MSVCTQCASSCTIVLGSSSCCPIRMPSYCRFFLMGSFSLLTFLPIFVTPEPGRCHHIRVMLQASEKKWGLGLCLSSSTSCFSPKSTQKRLCPRSLGSSYEQGVTSWRWWYEGLPLACLSLSTWAKIPLWGHRTPITYLEWWTVAP